MTSASVRQVPIGRHVKPVSKWDPKRDCKTPTFRYVDLSSVDQESKTIVANGEILAQDAPSRARQILQRSDVLVSTVRPNLNGVAYVPVELDGATGSTGFCVLRPDPQNLCSRYLFHWVRSPQFVSEMTKKATGQSYPAVSDRIVKESTIPLPPLDEQRCIAAILDEADALRRLRQRSIERLNDLRQSMLCEIAREGGEPQTIGELLKNGTLLYHKDGNHGSNYPRKDDFDEHGVAFISAKDLDGSGGIRPNVARLKKHKADQLKIGWLDPDDVLLAHNASVGGVAMYHGQFGPALIGTSLTVFRCDPAKLEPLVLAEALKGRDFQNQLASNMAQTTRNQVPITAQRRLNLQFPEMSFQQAFSGKIRSIVKVQEAFLEHEKDLERLFVSLQQRAFRGEL